MKLEFESRKSIYLQIPESIENDILNGVLSEGDQVPSLSQMAALCRINPATAERDQYAGRRRDHSQEVRHRDIHIRRGRIGTVPFSGFIGVAPGPVA
jgi:DNA-binding transcriptional MocR family regulator